MNTISRTIVGGILILLGLVLGYNSFTSEQGFWILLTYGLICLGVGIFILFNKKEDEIEQIKPVALKTKIAAKKKSAKK